MGAFTHFFKVRFAHPKIRLRSVHCGFLPKGKIEAVADRDAVVVNNLLSITSSNLDCRPKALFCSSQPDGRLSTTQLVENHRLDVERALVGEACAEAGLINQPAE
jgi:hypothetical protein